MAEINPASEERTAPMTGEDIVKLLDLAPHPEGGWFRQTWAAEGEGRPAGTCIYFLLQEEERSHWHRVDAAEIWHYYAGAPLILSIAAQDDGPATHTILGQNLADGQRPQAIVPTRYWQSARTTGPWSLVGCTVSPGFTFEGFELAVPGFDIP